jgi:hypothetical protein
MIRIQVTHKGNYPRGRVLGAEGNVIGEASSYTYGGAAWAIHTRDFGGYMPFDSKGIEYVGRMRP